MKFSSLVERNDSSLIVSPRHEAWLEQNNNAVYTTRALEFAAKELDKTQRDRSGSLGASSLGDCHRQQQFTFLGMPRLPSATQGVMRMHNGSFMHLRWQMEGLSEGWLAEAEVSTSSEEYKLRGTMDGLLYDGSILELKSINSNGFSRVNTFGPLLPHTFQMATYMLCTGRTSGVFIYECKDNQEYKEVVVNDDEMPIMGVQQVANWVWEHIEDQKLFEPLPDCIDQKGWKYNSCPYRDRCLGIHEWGEVDGRP